MAALQAVVTFLLISSAVAVPTTSSEFEVTKANGQFANSLYKILSEKDENVAFSPISAHMCLSMLYLGTAGSTKEACAKGLKISNPDVAAEGYRAVINALNKQDSSTGFYEDDKVANNVTVAIANKAYIDQNLQLKSSYQTNVQEKFDSEIESVDFSNGEKAASAINKWVKEKTKEKISQLVEKSDVQNARVVLVNAVYFKATWHDQFKVEQTKSEPFYLPDGSSTQVSMMHQQNTFKYKNDATLNARILQLPYRNHEYEMIIILPNEKNGIKDLDEKIVSTDINDITAGSNFEPINLALPKFKVEQKIFLKDGLTKIGMGEIFGPNADISGIAEGENLRVSEVVQKVFVQVDEFGSEAAAATAIVMEGSSPNYVPPTSIDFIVDHPFIFMLTHKPNRPNASTNVLFYGRVSKPTL